jgi:hypothetical protein
MSGFGYYARIIRDRSRPYGRRYIALRQATSSYAWLRQQSFQAIWAALGERFGFDDAAQRPTEGQLLVALGLLEQERRAFLPRLTALATQRREEKWRSLRYPRPGQLAALFPPPGQPVEFTAAAG